MSQITQRKSKGKKDAIGDDEFLEECIKLNETCSHATCEKSIKLIKLKCEFCNSYFCTSHVLPEIHGCGTAARKSCSKLMKTPNAEKKQELEKKMSNRLTRMQNERKKKGKCL